MNRYRVLLIEDDKTTRTQMSKVIRKEGFEVLVAEDGRQGIEIFVRYQPEIVITDLKMPDIDGLEVMHRIRDLSEHVQLILITAFGDIDTAISALHKGALDYLKKPIDLDSLSLALGRAKEKVTEYKKSSTFPTILIAEDECKTREHLHKVLKKEGWRVLSVADGREAVDLFKKEKIDVALLDLKMPRTSGLESLRQMREVSDDFEAIVFTGYGDETGVVEAMRMGASNFIRKPIDLEQLLAVVENALVRLQARRSLRYRTRELELAREIIAKITSQKEIVIDVRNHKRKKARQFANQLLDTIPIGLVAFSRDLEILYINRNLIGAFQYKPKRIDEQFVKSLSKIGIRRLSFKTLISVANSLFQSESSEIKNIKTGKFSYLTLTPITITREGLREKAILTVFRGER